MAHVITFFASKWTYTVLRIVGSVLLAGYLILTGDWRFSAPWALGFFAISLSVGWLVVALDLHRRFPKLDRYLLFSPKSSGTSAPLSRDEWALAHVKYQKSGFRGMQILLAPTEDGFFGVPVLLIGIGVLPAVIAGIGFGLMHLGRFTYLECIAKAITYTLVCYFVLPHGLLTVAVGHLLMDAIGWVFLMVAEHQLSKKLRTNPAVDGDPRKAAGAPDSDGYTS